MCRKHTILGSSQFLARQWIQNLRNMAQSATALLEEVRQVVEYLQVVKDNGNLSEIEWADLLNNRQA